jgi:hypothetical protein
MSSTHIASNLFYIHLIHIIIIGSLLLYVGIKGKTMPQFMYHILLVIGILILVAHGYSVISKYGQKNSGLWVNLFHIFIVAPVILLIGLKREQAPYYLFQFMIMLGFAAIGYHGYFMIKELMDN